MDNLESKILELGNKVAEGLQLCVPLVRVISANTLVVQIFLENKDFKSVSIEQCSAFSRELSVLLDVESVMPDVKYTLEVSSLGINRPLLTLTDYQRFKNHEVKILTKNPIDGSKTLIGKLVGVTTNGVTIELTNQDKQVVVDFNNVTKASLDLIKNLKPQGRKNGK
ncbi:Ribosome maturation factor RimP [Candidatus Hepatincola sp. Pdp]